jgi:hypothetical protein
MVICLLPLGEIGHYQLIELLSQLGEPIDIFPKICWNWHYSLNVTG